MELRQLEYFLMVSEVNSFTRAAERLYISQPAVTNAIRNLEEELGVSLFDRNSKKIVLTAEGKIFLRHVKNIMLGINKSLAEIDMLKNLNGGSLRIGITPLAGITSVISTIKKFHTCYPEIKLIFTEDHSEQLEQFLLEDKIDVAFIYTEYSQDALTYITLSKEELFLCCNRQHPLRRHNSISLKELANESLILFANNCYYRKHIIKNFEEANTLPELLFESNHIETIKRLIISNIGISILPETLCESEHDLLAISLNPPIFMQTCLAYKTNRCPSRATEAFINIIAKGDVNNESTSNKRSR